ncbi:MAG TPA: hypothetical protein VFA97_00965 [Gaiellaceae bacterium]|nr:hypothetical protein [Gaiellaceae bacterium]
MEKVRTTVTIDQDVLRATQVCAARTGTSVSDLVNSALRRHLGVDLLQRLWSRTDLDEEAAMSLALEAQRVVRQSRR